MYTVYIKKFEDGSVYIGSTSNFKQRMQQHKYRAKTMERDYPLYRKMNTYAYIDEIIKDNIENENEAIELEEKITIEYRKNGYEVLNIMNGRKLSKEMIEKIKKSISGKNHYMYGKHMSEATKKKISEAHKGEKNNFYGKHHTEETKEKLRQINLGKKVSDETRKKLSLLFSGKNNPMYGKHHTQETKDKLKNMLKGEKSVKSYPIEWYETHSSRRDKFKRTCQRREWNFCDFEEIESNESYTTPKGQIIKKYFYRLKKTEVDDGKN